MAIKIMSLLRKRGVLMLVISVASALLAAKGGGIGNGFWEGPL